MPRIIHFEIAADDPERAVKFYETVFGWKISKWDGPEEYWLVATGEEGQPGINGGLMKRDSRFGPVTNVIDVPSVDDFLAKITANGGEVYVPKMAIPGVGWIAYAKDTEETIFGIMQPDSDAK